MTYGSENWTNFRTVFNYGRRMIGITWKDRIRNDDVWRRCKLTKRTLIGSNIKQMTFIGHIYIVPRYWESDFYGYDTRHWKRRSSEAVPYGQFTEVDWTLKIDLFRKMWDREEWRTIVTNAVRHGRMIDWTEMRARYESLCTYSQHTRTEFGE